MYQSHWRNPYTVAKRKRTPTAINPSPAPQSLSVIPQQAKEAQNMKLSLVKVREQVRGVREQLQQMESTIETLFKVMDAVERFGTNGKSGKKGKGAPTSLLGSFQNIDFKQIMNLLQSPLVQALVETMAEEEPKEEKEAKEVKKVKNKN